MKVDEAPGRPRETTWHAGAQNECRLCHNAGSGFVLGFVPNQLSFPPGRSDGTNQMRVLGARQVLARAEPLGPDNPLRLVDPHDDSKSLDDRARSYLHVNCSSCHHKRGNAIVSFYLRRDLPFDQLNTNKGTGIGTFGMRNAKVIVPGDPYRSVLFYRMSKLGYSRMPYIGSRSVDSRGISLVESWIRSLKHGVDARTSAPLKRNSPEWRALRLLVTKRGTDREIEAALKRLMSTTEGTLALAGRMHAPALADTTHRRAVSLAKKLTSSDRRGLLEEFVPEPERRKQLGPNTDPAPILALKGDIPRGRLIFFSDGARCRNCHDVSDAGKSLGPSLKEINKKYPKLPEMVKHILQPSLKVEDVFAGQIIATDDGRVLTGLVQSKSNEQVVLRTAEGKTIRLRASDIDRMRKSPKSLMPDFILSDLTAQEAADLIAYIRSLGAK